GAQRPAGYATQGRHGEDQRHGDADHGGDQERTLDDLPRRAADLPRLGQRRRGQHGAAHSIFPLLVLFTMMRAVVLTMRVITNRARPAATRACRCASPASPKLLAMRPATDP